MTILTYGTMLDNALDAADRLANQGIQATVLRIMNLSQLYVAEIRSACCGKHLIVLEEVSGGTGIAGDLALQLGKASPELIVHSRDLGKNFVPHGSVNKLYEHCGLDGKSIAEYIQEVLRNEN